MSVNCDDVLVLCVVIISYTLNYTSHLIYNDCTSDNNTNIMNNIIWINSSAFVYLIYDFMFI